MRRRLAASLVAIAALLLALAFRSRLGADFWPLDSSRVGPNILAELVQVAVLFIAAVLLYPPWRRAAHRLIDGKLERLHAHHAHLDARHDELADHLARIGRSLTDLHEHHARLHDKLDALTHKEP